MSPTLPRGLARFNKRFTNKVQGTFAGRLAPWAVVAHRGRRTGRLYATPVVAWVAHGRFHVVLFYGVDSDWVRNVLAAEEATVLRSGRMLTLSDSRIVNADDPELSGLVRRLGRPAGKVLVAEVSPRASR